VVTPLLIGFHGRSVKLRCYHRHAYLYWYKESSEVMYVVPYDLNNETLILPTESVLHEDNRRIADCA
jgi:hypothetical protein